MSVYVCACVYVPVFMCLCILRGLDLREPMRKSPEVAGVTDDLL